MRSLDIGASAVGTWVAGTSLEVASDESTCALCGIGAGVHFLTTFDWTNLAITCHVNTVLNYIVPIASDVVLKVPVTSLQEAGEAIGK